MSMHAVHTGRPETLVDWVVDRSLSWPAASAVLTPFDFQSLRYLSDEFNKLF